MKTCLYVDGINLYQTLLKGTPYKWLDVIALFERQLLPSVAPDADVVCLKYFTAPVLASYSRHGKEADLAQSTYLRALRTSGAKRVDIIEGFHLFEQTAAPRWIEGVPPHRDHMVQVWRLKEKQTAVQLAMHLYRDAVQGRYAQQVICSNDADLEPCLAFLRADAPSVRLGLVTPLPLESSQTSQANKRLAPYAHWVRTSISRDELAAAQFADPMLGGKNPLNKPGNW